MTIEEGDRRFPKHASSQQQQECNRSTVSSAFQETAEDDLATILQRLKDIGSHPKDLPQHSTLPRASVLVPLFVRRRRTHHGLDDESQTDDGPSSAVHVLLTQRPMSLRTHAGEVCFPGGKQDPEDGSDDFVTALREAWEEVGLASNLVQPLCRLATLESYTGLCVTPIVGWVGQRELVAATAAKPLQLTINRDEVEDAFTVPLEYFANDANLSAPKRMVEWRGGLFEMRTYHYEDAESGKTFKIWGLTAYIAHLVSQIAFRKDPGTASPQVEQLNNNSLQQPEGIEKETVFKGYLLRQQLGGSSRRPFWAKRYFVLENGMLHQYDGERQALRRSASATKKDRMPLMHVDIVITSHGNSGAAAGGDGQYGFVVSALSGRVKWHLAAASSEERRGWTTELERFRHQTLER